MFPSNGGQHLKTIGQDGIITIRKTLIYIKLYVIPAIMKSSWLQFIHLLCFIRHRRSCNENEKIEKHDPKLGLGL